MDGHSQNPERVGSRAATFGHRNVGELCLCGYCLYRVCQPACGQSRTGGLQINETMNGWQIKNDGAAIVKLSPFILVVLGVSALVLVALVQLSEILLPFVLGFTLAYFLDPLADHLGMWVCRICRDQCDYICLRFRCWRGWFSDCRRLPPNWAVWSSIFRLHAKAGRLDGG